MSITEVAGATVITGPHIQLYQLLVWRAAIKLEARGLRHSRGSVTALVKKRLGFRGNRARVLAQLEDHINRWMEGDAQAEEPNAVRDATERLEAYGEPH